MRGRRTLGQNVQDVFGVLHPATGGKLVAEQDFLASIMDLRTEYESAALRRRFDRPAGERARDVDHVLLRIAAVDAEGVQLEQLTTVVLVQSLTLALLYWALLL